MTDLREADRVTDAAAHDHELHRALLEDMLLARRASERMWNLQRQGVIATIPPLTGQEATIVGVVRALDLRHDWFAPYYRELLGMAAFGDEFLEQVVLYWRGHPDGGYIPDGVRCLPPQISLGSQVPHAAGLAWGLKLRGEPGVACTWIGDGATSEGDFYEALNLAGVHRLPLLVAVINNGWAISTPTSRQTAAPTFAAKAAAAGVEGVRVDGNDVLAVIEATRAARARAVGGEGPTLLELVTYRMAAHTNSDDPTRYVPEAELAAWRERCPVDALRRHMTASGRWDDTAHRALVDAVEARLERILDSACARPVDPIDGFDHRFDRGADDGDARLRRQRAELAARLDPAGVADEARGAQGVPAGEEISWQP